MRRWPGLPEPDDGGDEMLQLLADAEGDKDRSGPDGDGELQGDQRPERDEPNGAATLTITAGRGEPQTLGCSFSVDLCLSMRWAVER